MNSLETLSRKTDIAGQQAELADLVPFVVQAEAIAGYPPFPFPLLGTYRPPGWRMCNTMLCHAEGTDLSEGPAMNASQLRARLQPGYGYAIVEETEHLRMVGEFVPPGHMIINSKLVKTA